MRHLVGFFLLSGGLLGGCSMSSVGSMDPEDGGKCDKAMETRLAADGCTECSCDGTRWSCQSDDCVEKCTAGDSRVSEDGCSSCTCASDGTWDCEINNSCNQTECEAGETKLGDGGCFRCACDETGHWDCPDIDCMQCTEGETSENECFSCVCNEQGTWTCSGFFDGVCGTPMCTPGEVTPAGDGCNTCTCQMDGTLACTMRACMGPLVCDAGLADCDGDESNGCETNLERSPDNCGQCGNVCLSATGAMQRCVAGMCASTDGGGTCVYQGTDYELGDSFQARDGCNVCTCSGDEMGAAVECTTLGCMCNPSNETNYREYVGMSAAECMAMDLVECPDHTSYFGNECGCGCQQSDECPASYHCGRNETMTCADLEVRCPYTELTVDI
jgi:hypothetical protein